MDASKFLVDFFKGLSPEIKLDLFNASIELLRASITPQPETASPGGIVGTPNTQKEFRLNTPEKIKEALDQHPIMGEAEMHRHVRNQTEPPETEHYEEIPATHSDYYKVYRAGFIRDFDSASKPHLEVQWKMGLLHNSKDVYEPIERAQYLIAETFIRRYLRRRGQGKYMPAGNNFTIAYNHNSRRYGVFPASPASQNTLPWLYAQNRDILQHLINNHTHHLDTIFEVTRDGGGDENSSLSPDRTEPQPPNTAPTGGTVTYYSV